MKSRKSDYYYWILFKVIRGKKEHGQVGIYR